MLSNFLNWGSSKNSERVESVNFLNSLHQHVSHAFAPIFRYTPEHPVRQCKYCFSRVRHTPKMVNEKIPLGHQNQVLTSTKLNRFSMIIGDELSVVDDCKTIYEVCKNNLKCKVNRLLMNHVDYIFPTLENIEVEVKNMFESFKINDQMILYITGQTRIPLEKWLTWIGLLKNQCCLWVVDDTDFSEEKENVFPFLYKYDVENDTVVHQKKVLETFHEEKNIRIHYLGRKLLSGGSDRESVLTKTFLYVMGQYGFRMSLNRLLKECQLKMNIHYSGYVPLMYTNYPMNSKKTYFGFG
jgi:hypothetical protein